MEKHSFFFFLFFFSEINNYCGEGFELGGCCDEGLVLGATSGATQGIICDAEARTQVSCIQGSTPVSIDPAPVTYNIHLVNPLSFN